MEQALHRSNDGKGEKSMSVNLLLSKLDLTRVDWTRVTVTLLNCTMPW